MFAPCSANVRATSSSRRARSQASTEIWTRKPAEAPPGYSDGAQANSALPKKAPGGGAPTGGACAGIIGTQCAAASDFCKLPEGQCTFHDAGHDSGHDSNHDDSGDRSDAAPGA